MEPIKVLLVDDHALFRKGVASALALQRDIEVVGEASNGQEALTKARELMPDVILMDISMPGMDGLEACRIIKEESRTQNIPVIMATAKSEESDVIVGLQLGADDYIPKPFSPRILVARVKTILRRFARKDIPQETRNLGAFLMDIPKHKVIYENKPIELTTIEFNILEFLSRHPGRVFSRDQILDQAWSEGKFIVDRAVDVHVRSLRKKLKKGADLIETVRGVGYRFKEIDEKS